MVIYNHCPRMAVASLGRNNVKLTFCDDSWVKTKNIIFTTFLAGQKALANWENNM